MRKLNENLGNEMSNVALGGLLMLCVVYVVFYCHFVERVQAWSIVQKLFRFAKTIIVLVKRLKLAAKCCINWNFCHGTL